MSPSAIANAGGLTTSTTASGDLSGTYASPTLAKIQGTPISTAAPSDGQLMVYSQSSGEWGPQTGEYVSYIPGIVADGVTDNYAAINSAMTSMSGGGTVHLPSGKIAVSQTLILPAGVFIEGQGGSTSYGEGSGYGTVLIGIAGNTISEIVHLANSASGLKNIAVNAYSTSGTFGRAVLLDADSLTLNNVHLEGGYNAATLDSTSNATNVDMVHVASRGYSGNFLAINALGADWVCSNVRTTGGCSFGAPGSLWSSSHFSQCQGLTVNSIVTADTVFSGCYFDSINAPSPVALIQVTGGSSVFSNCRYFQNFSYSGFPVISKTGGVINLSGGIVISPSQGVAGQFSCLLSGGSTWDSVTDLILESNTVPVTGSVATLFLSGAGGPAIVKNVSYDGVIQRSLPALANAVTTGGPSIAMGTNGSYGAATTIISDTNVSGFMPIYMAVLWSGTIGSETLTIELVPTYSDGTTGPAVTLSSTTLQEQGFGASTIVSLFKDQTYITQIAVAAKTTAATTSVVCHLYYVAQNLI